MVHLYKTIDNRLIIQPSIILSDFEEKKLLKPEMDFFFIIRNKYRHVVSYILIFTAFLVSMPLSNSVKLHRQDLFLFAERLKWR
jgi:hypothetical protein